jgi:hypothetical protein
MYHEIVKCSCGTILQQCRCFTHNKAVRVVQDGCQDCMDKLAAIAAAASAHNCHVKE